MLQSLVVINECYRAGWLLMIAIQGLVVIDECYRAWWLFMSVTGLGGY